MANDLRIDPAAIYDSLTKKQRRFVDARVAGNSASASARIAGMDEANGRKFDQDPRVVTLRRELSRQALRKLVLTREDVLQGFLDAVDAAATSTELVGAWREIGRLIGAYEPEEVKVSIEDLTPAHLRGMTDAQLAKIAGLQPIDAEYEVLDD